MPTLFKHGTIIFSSIMRCCFPSADADGFGIHVRMNWQLLTFFFFNDFSYLYIYFFVLRFLYLNHVNVNQFGKKIHMHLCIVWEFGCPEFAQCICVAVECYTALLKGSRQWFLQVNPKKVNSGRMPQLSTVTRWRRISHKLPFPVPSNCPSILGWTPLLQLQSV